MHGTIRAVRTAATLTLVWLFSPVVAAAHPLIDQARDRFRSADFPGAIEALDAADRATDLDRDDAVELYELRAVIHMALRQRDEADRALRALASLSPSHSFAREAPPDVVDRFRILRETVPGRVAIEVARRETTNGLLLTPRALDDPLGLIRRTRVHARVDAGDWQTSDDRALAVDASDGQTVEWYAEGIGPGGAVIATVASESAPMRFSAGEDPLGDGGTSAWIWVGLGVGAVAIAVAVAVILSATSGDPDTRVEGPIGFP